MPKKRQPSFIWNVTRRTIWKRDNCICVHCKKDVTLKECNIDHIKSGKKGTNNFSNLRTLCLKCHILRKDFRHRGMTARGLQKGLIPPDWRKLTW